MVLENSSRRGKSPDMNPFFFFSGGTVFRYVVLSIYLSFCSDHSILGGSSVLHGSLVVSQHRRRCRATREKSAALTRGKCGRFGASAGRQKTACRSFCRSSPALACTDPPTDMEHVASARERTRDTVSVTLSLTSPPVCARSREGTSAERVTPLAHPPPQCCCVSGRGGLGAGAGAAARAEGTAWARRSSRRRAAPASLPGKAEAAPRRSPSAA